MKTLALELSAARGSLAWMEEESLLRSSEFANDRKHSGLFFENLQACLHKFGPPDLIVVGIGPGSYAGVRIALATANGLRVANNAQLIGVPSVCAMPVDSPEYCVVGDARRQTFYFSRVVESELREWPDLLSESELHRKLEPLEIPILASESLSQFPRASLCYPSAKLLAEIGSRAPEKYSSNTEPIYLRAPHITISRK